MATKLFEGLQNIVLEKIPAVYLREMSRGAQSPELCHGLDSSMDLHIIEHLSEWSTSRTSILIKLYC
jgi:hypothetical protein